MPTRQTFLGAIMRDNSFFMSLEIFKALKKVIYSVTVFHEINIVRTL